MTSTAVGLWHTVYNLFLVAFSSVSLNNLAVSPIAITIVGSSCDLHVKHCGAIDATKPGDIGKHGTLLTPVTDFEDTTAAITTPLPRLICSPPMIVTHAIRNNVYQMECSNQHRDVCVSRHCHLRTKCPPEILYRNVCGFQISFQRLDCSCRGSLARHFVYAALQEIRPFSAEEDKRRTQSS